MTARQVSPRSKGRSSVDRKATRQRTCVACRVTADKRRLHRIVRAPDGTVRYDPSGTAAGRGAYLCARPECAAVALKRRGLQRALKVDAAAQVPAAVEELRRALDAAASVGGTGGAVPGTGAPGESVPEGGSDLRASEHQEEVRTG
jgi:uncharacterized protein